jgi:hypothetical protein
MDVTVALQTAYIYLSPPAPIVHEGLSISVATTPAAIAFHTTAPNIHQEWYEYVTVEQPAHISIAARPAHVEIYSLRIPRTERRLQHSSWQARLGAKLDPIKRKILDNQILLTSHPTDMLRIRTKRDERTHDVLSRTIISSEVLPVVLPIMKDVPLRRLQHEDGLTTLSMSVMEHQEKNPFEAFCPLAGMLERDDLLFRILKDPYTDSPYFMVLQVKDELGTLAYSSLLYVKYKLSFYDEPLPGSVLDTLAEFAAKREELTW